jgi:membrane associated rhomboid family serine protease
MPETKTKNPMDSTVPPFETILRQCATVAPQPWYPSAYAQSQGISRDQIDPFLDQLRMAGLIHLTDWVQGLGQGYALTAEGERVLQNPRQLARLNRGKIDTRLPLPQEALTNSRLQMPWERGEAVRASLLTPATPVVSVSLIVLNLLWFVAGLAVAYREQLPLNTFFYRSDPKVLQETGAVWGPLLLRGEWWRLITCCFVHIGFIHLAVNMYSLYVIGPFLEQLWGHVRFLVLYLISGLGGSCVAMVSNPRSLLAGASGALWGILVAHAMWIVLNRRHLPGPLVTTWLRQLGIVFLANIFITWQVPNISAAAHFGGGGVGAVTAVLLNYERFGRGWQRFLAILGLVGIPVVLVGVVVRAENTDPRWGQLGNALEREEWGERDASLTRLLNEGQRLYDTGVRPLAQKGVPADAENFLKGTALFDRTRIKLEEAVQLLKAAGPFHDPDLEEKRTGELRRLERTIHSLELDECKTFVAPWVIQVKGDTLGLYEKKVVPLLKIDADKRNSDTVKSAILLLEKRQAKLAEAAKALKESNHSQNETLRQTWQAAVDWLAAEGEVLQLSENCLREGSKWTTDQENQLDEKKESAVALARSLTAWLQRSTGSK